MVIEDIIDNEDGSATLVCDFTKTEVRFLLEYALMDILRKHALDILAKESQENDSQV